MRSGADCLDTNITCVGTGIAMFSFVAYGNASTTCNLLSGSISCGHNWSIACTRIGGNGYMQGKCLTQSGGSGHVQGCDFSALVFGLSKEHNPSSKFGRLGASFHSSLERLVCFLSEGELEGRTQFL